MSDYFQVLKRIEKDRSIPAQPLPTVVTETLPTVAPLAPTRALDTTLAATPPVGTRPLRAIASAATTALVSTTPTTTPAVAQTAARRDFAAPARQPVPVLSDEAQRGIAILFDNIRALASGQATRALVFAGTSDSSSVRAVTEGLAQHAQRHGMDVFVAELMAADGGHALVARTLGTAPGVESTLAVDLNSGTTADELRTWLDSSAARSDLVLLEAPPLAESIDAALLACACDGLVIVADSEVTPRAALQLAAERAQTAGCRTLGVVMNGTKDRVPNWMRSLFGNASRGRRTGNA